MKKMLSLILSLAFLASYATAKSATYEETVAQWTSYKDVVNWMSENFRYDYTRRDFLRKIGGWQPQNPEQTFKLRSGSCQDRGNFGEILPGTH